MSWWKVAWFVIWVVVLAIGIVVLWTQEHVRRFRMQRLARRLGLKFVGTNLPGALCLYGTPFNTTRMTWNVMDGERNGLRIVAFDCEMQESKTTSWRRTVIAAKTQEDVFGAPALYPELTVHKDGGWAVLYRPKGFGKKESGLLPISTLETYLLGTTPSVTSGNGGRRE